MQEDGEEPGQAHRTPGPGRPYSALYSVSSRVKSYEVTMPRVASEGLLYTWLGL